MPAFQPEARQGCPAWASLKKSQPSRLYSWQASLLETWAKDRNEIMKLRYTTLLLTFVCLPAVPVLAQTTIGGGSCTSGTLNGTYEFLLNGRQVAATGAVSKVFQGVGTSAFDGLSKVTLTMTANIVGATQSFGTPTVYSGTYSLQSNCVGSISITSGDTGTFTVEAYAQVKASTGALRSEEHTSELQSLRHL